MRRDLCRMMRSSHYQTYVDVLVGTYMGEDDRITLRTICGLVEFPSEPAPELRELLTRTSEVRRPPELDFYGGSVTEFLSRSNPAHLVQEIVKLKVVPTYGNVLQDVDRRGATTKLMTALSLMGQRGSRPPTRVIRCLKDRIVFWAGAAILYPLKDLLSVETTTGLRETVEHLVENPIR